MKFADKDFLEYWKVIKIPTYILVAWGVLGFIISAVSFSLYQSVFAPVAGWILTVSAFGFIGWFGVKDHKVSLKFSAWAGALSGAISGFAGAGLGILMYHFVPEVIQAALAQTAASGVDAATLQSYMSIGIYIGLITGPLVTAIIGAIISTLASFIAQKL
ncbi:MAG: hypothetical protein ABIC04_08950 [Nanoarchaeota archaeon]